MQRLFSTFPSGPAGVGVLVLRLLLCARLATDSVSLVIASSPAPVDLMAAIVRLVCAAASVMGFLTPLAQIVVVVDRAWFLGIQLLAAAWPITADAWWWPPLTTLGLALSIALLGPGAYSVDARLFGRREIILKPRAGAGR